MYLPPPLPHTSSGTKAILGLFPLVWRLIIVLAWFGFKLTKSDAQSSINFEGFTVYMYQYLESEPGSFQYSPFHSVLVYFENTANDDYCSVLSENDVCGEYLANRQ